MPSERETFIKVSDHMPDHPKVVGLSDKAFRALVTLWCYCSRYRTDGVVPAGLWREKAPGKVGRELVEAGLAEPGLAGQGGGVMHDYLKHQRSKEHIEALSAKRAVAGHRGGKAQPSSKQDGSNLLSKNEAPPPPDDRGSTSYFPDRGAEEEKNSSSKIADAIPDRDPPDDLDEPREDIEALCRHLADQIEANGSKRPRITEKWRTEARLLLDRDGRDLEKSHRLIDWCQAHHHWRSRVMAMPKFRSEYDAMRMQANAEHERSTRPKPHAVPTTTQRVSGALALLRPEEDDPPPIELPGSPR